MAVSSTATLNAPIFVICCAVNGYAYYCYAWDSNGNCTNSVDIEGPVGQINVKFVKLLAGTLSDSFMVLPNPDGSYYLQQNIDDLFSAIVTGTMFGDTIPPINPNYPPTDGNGSIEFVKDPETFHPATSLKSTLSEKAQKRLKILQEKLQKRHL
jgi:hypothetical protein